MPQLSELLPHLTFYTAIKIPRKYKRSHELSKTPNTYYIHTDDNNIKLVTRIDGQDEVVNTVRRGDVVITGPKSEQYAVDAKKFPDLYDLHEGIAIPRPNARTVARVTQSAWNFAFGNNVPHINFQTSWGEDMILKQGDYLVKDGRNFYRVAASAYNTTYKRLA